MHFYLVGLPNEEEPLIFTNARGLKGLPVGPRVFAVFTEPDGPFMDEQEISVEDGREVFRRRRSIHRQLPTKADPVQNKCRTPGKRRLSRKGPASWEGTLAFAGG